VTAAVPPRRHRHRDRSTRYYRARHQVSHRVRTWFGLRIVVAAGVLLIVVSQVVGCDWVGHPAAAQVRAPAGADMGGTVGYLGAHGTAVRR
jgi:hypothetical protein